MQCEKFEARLQDLLDQRQRPEFDARLLEHAEACDQCRETLMLQEQLFAGLDLWEAPRMSDGFTARVIQQHMTEVAAVPVARPTATRGMVWKLLAGAVAASLLVAAIATSAFYGANQPASSAPTIVNKPAVKDVEEPAPVPEPKAIVEVVQAPAVVPSVSVQSPLPDHLAMQFVESAPEFLDGHATGRMIREVTTSLPEVSVVEENIPGLRPITSSFSLTIGMVRKTLPGGRDNSSRTEPKPQPPGKPQAEVSRDTSHVLV